MPAFGSNASTSSCVTRFAHTPFYRERIGRPNGPVKLGRLPTLEKATMMERFDELVTDPRLRRDELLANGETLTGHALHLSRSRAMTTSGSSGRKELFAPTARPGAR